MKREITRREILIGSAGLLAVGIGQAEKASPKVGCQTNGYVLKAGDFPALLHALDNLKSLGYTGFECNVRFVEGQFGRTAEARREIEKTGVEFIGGHYSMKQAEADTFPRVVSGVAALGARAIVMSGAGLSPEGRFEKDAVRKKAAAMGVLAKLCRKQGLRLAYHNHNPEFANHNAEIEALAAATNPELVDFLMDAGHGYLGGGNPAEFMTRHAPRILGCHVKTFKGKNEQVPLGQGDFGFEALAEAIRKTGWSGWLITEEGGGAKGGNTAALGPDREYIRRTFGV
jgi:sugar phosphate isomerase/epimerase